MNTFLLRSPSAIGTSRLQFGGSNIRTQHMHHHPALFISTSMKCTTPLAFRSKYIQPLQTPQLYRTGVALRMSSSSSMQPSSSSSPSSDSSTNSIHPSLNEIGVDISIEYCSSCRWMLRSSWIASELLTTFTNEPKLTSVTMIPQSPPLSEGGIFRVCASYADANNENEDQIIVLWDRKVEGRFPESKEVKQLVRDCVNPDKDLGHSDNKQQSSSDGVVPKQSSEKVDCIECNEEQQDKSTSSQQAGKPTKDKNDEKETNSSPKIPSIFYKQNKVSIEYSTGSNIDSPENELYRAAYYANELLSMIFERNSWWKKYCQCQGGDSSDATVIEETVPVVVDIVSLIPNRKENGVFVSLCILCFQTYL